MHMMGLNRAADSNIFKLHRHRWKEFALELEWSLTPHLTRSRSLRSQLSSQSLDWYWQTEQYRKNTQTKYNSENKQHKIKWNKTTLVQSPLMTGQETRWAYSTMIPSQHMGNRIGTDCSNLNESHGPTHYMIWSSQFVQRRLSAVQHSRNIHMVTCIITDKTTRQ